MFISGGVGIAVVQHCSSRLQRIAYTCKSCAIPRQKKKARQFGGPSSINVSFGLFFHELHLLHFTVELCHQDVDACWQVVVQVQENGVLAFLNVVA